MSLVYNQLFNETFSGGNANPIDPAKWQTYPTFADFQQLNHLMQSSVDDTVNVCSAEYIGISWPANQYIDIKIHQLTNQAFLYPGLRYDALGLSGYTLNLEDNNDGTSVVIIRRYDAGNPVILSVLGLAVPVATDDVFRFGIFGTTLYAFKNGVALGSPVVDATYASGNADMFVDVFVVGDVQLSGFAGGSITQSASTAHSVPDCRVAPFGPNASRDVQGTLTYDVQTSSNSSIPPTDSRAAGAPVDCRKSPNIPQNSRTPGVYGPGEN